MNNDITTTLELLGDAAQSLALLQGLWRARNPEAWSTNPDGFVMLGQRILKLGEPLLAYDVVAEGTKYFPQHTQLRQLLALALARSGAAASANAVLIELYREGHRDQETIGLLARTHKDLANEVADISESKRHLQQAYGFYAEAYQITGGYWSGINAATLAQLSGRREEAETLARQVNTQCRSKLSESGDKTERYWLLSTLGEAALLLQQWSEAEDWYAQAVESGHGQWGNLQSTRRNAALLMQDLGSDKTRIDRLFKLPSVVVFTGHMADRTGREAPRFPPELEDKVKDALRRRLEELNTGFGYAAAACGSDILFHEALFEMHAESHVVLPFEKELFVKESVDITSSANWVERFENVLGLAVAVHEASKQSRKATGASYEFGNQLLHGLAKIRAEQLETKLVPMAVWDGNAGDGPGGTAGLVERWRKLGLHVDIIDVGAMLPRPIEICNPEERLQTPTVSATASDFIPEVRALLFADAAGFSKLTDEELPPFVQHFLGLVGKLAAESEHQPLLKNTWGDGLYFVFENVREAGRFALNLRDAVRNTDWSKKGLPNLSLRIGLHAGPVYSCMDPVTERLNYIGAHVSGAARIEPITPAGQVYSSQEFAALAAGDDVKEFRCDYVGQTPMAKHYGTFPTYIVRRTVSGG